jgi:hypothetical protein
LVVAPIPVVVSIAITVPIPVSIPITVTPASFDHEISPTAVIDPDAPVIRAPTVAFGAGGFATLIDQSGSA